MIRRGEPWERDVDPAALPPPVVRGSDHDLAAAVGAGGRELRYVPEGPSDLARALGLGEGGGGAGEGQTVAVDLLHVDEGELAVNSVVLGVPPHRLGRRHRAVPVTVRVDGAPLDVGRVTSVVVVNGGWLLGHDVAPRAHPGDGRLDVQVYAVPGRERHRLRKRLTTASHLPHPGIAERRARRVTVEAARPMVCLLDGREIGRRSSLAVDVRAGALHLHLGEGGGGGEAGRVPVGT